MPEFQYRVMTLEGNVKEGSEIASSYTDMLARLRQRQYYPLRVEEKIVGKDIKTLPMFEKVHVKHIAVFCRQFSTMLNAGVTIVGCLDILRQQTQNKRLRSVTDELYEGVQKGLTLSQSLKKHPDVFPDLMTQMVEAGESSGSLDVVMQRVAVHYEKENKINSRMKSAMVYPAVLAVACVGVVIVLLTKVFPTFLGLFEGSDVPLPGPTKLLIFLSGVLSQYWYFFLLAVLVAVLLFRRYIGTEEGRLKFDGWKLNIPVVKGLTQKTVSARFTRTLSTLLASGIPMLQAMEDSAGVVGNAVVAKSLMSAREEIRKGAPLSSPVRRMGHFPPMVPSMIEIGEGSGSLDEILDKTANIYDEEVELEVQRMLTLLEPLMIVIMALLVGFIAISMVLPMYDMLQTIQ